MKMDIQESIRQKLTEIEQQENVTILHAVESGSLRPYGGFERVGALPWALPASDEQLRAEPGDVMLYQGNQMCVFTGSNSWAYTRLGHVEGVSADELAQALGDSVHPADWHGLCDHAHVLPVELRALLGCLRRTE